MNWIFQESDADSVNTDSRDSSRMVVLLVLLVIILIAFGLTVYMNGCFQCCMYQGSLAWVVVHRPPLVWDVLSIKTCFTQSIFHWVKECLSQSKNVLLRVK